MSDSGPIIVMGASSGVGQCVIAQQTALGKKCAAVGRDMDKLQALHGSNALVTCFQSDALDRPLVKQRFEEIAGLLGTPSGYVHCVGSILVAPLHRTTDAQWDQTIALNLTTAAVGLREFITLVKGKRKANAVLISTCAAALGVANHEAVAAAKGGLEAMAQSAAATYASDGIRVNVVAPGLTNTPMASGFLKSEAMLQAAGKQYPLGGVNAASEVADAIVWLLSDASSRITGAIIPVDGGFSTIRPFVK
jgi:NAD(P)-dependent dehydrogenase (short-subunit alcohol dehydrogenase family)